MRPGAVRVTMTSAVFVLSALLLGEACPRQDPCYHRRSLDVSDEA